LTDTEIRTMLTLLYQSNPYLGSVACNLSLSVSRGKILHRCIYECFVNKPYNEKNGFPKWQTTGELYKGRQLCVSVLRTDCIAFPGKTPK